MPFAPLIRKQILQALEEHILPALSSQTVTQVLADEPSSLLQVEHWIERKKPLTDKATDPLRLIRHWELDGMLALQAPSLGFAYSGVSYERVGITASMQEQVKPSKRGAGITGMLLPAPGVVFYPAGTPHADGHISKRSWQMKSQVLAITFMRDEIRPFLVRRDGLLQDVTHHLQVRDALLVQMGGIYLDELRQPNSESYAQAQLLALMGRLHRHLKQNQPLVSNSSWVKPVQFSNLQTAKYSEHQLELGRDLTYYILTQLQMPLSTETLAGRFNISTVHLNRIFQQIYGTSPMRYVTLQRIQAAKQILVDTPERVSDIALLVGFASSSSFCTLFARHTGMSPNEFRRASRRAIHL